MEGGIGKMGPAETVIAATLFPPITGALGGKGKTVSGGKGKSGTGKGKAGAGKVRGKGKSGHGKGKSHGGKGKGEAYPRGGLAKGDSSEKRELQKKAKRRSASWSLFIHRVLRQSQADSRANPKKGGTDLCSLSQKAMNVLNHCMIDTFDRVVQQATMLTRFREQKTVSAASVVTAIRLMMESDESDSQSILSQCLGMCRASHEMFNRDRALRLAAAAARKQAEAAEDYDPR
eukprot:Rhum_TRINITY_DN12673_c0_g1::Rhum_TRINITY_DN12673_c0_g1_i2::g.53608::m.53608